MGATMLYTVVFACAVLALASGKEDNVADFYKDKVTEAFKSRSGVVDFDGLGVEWELLYHALKKQGVMYDKAKGIDLKALGSFLNLTDDRPHRRRLSVESDAVSSHNNFRSQTARGIVTDNRGGYWPKGANLNRMRWDDELARVAQNYANKCIFQHNDKRDRQFNEDNASFETGWPGMSMGENIAWGYGSVSRSIDKGWFDEHRLGYYTTGACMSGCGETGHFLQMVADGARYIGCGYASCNQDYLVCNYYPAWGQSDYPYVSGNPCTKCDADRKSNDCSDSLCGGCGDPKWPYCLDYYSNCEDNERWCLANCDTSDHEICKGCKNTCHTYGCPITSVYQGSC